MMELEEFSTSKSEADQDPELILRVEADTAKSLAFEDGYKSGWEDAINAESEKQGHVGPVFARNLQEVAFTFHEARAQLIKSFEPFLEEIVKTVVPSIARESISAIIFEELLPLIEMAPEAPVEIVVAEGCSASVEGFLTNANLNTFRVVEEATLAEGQVFLKVGSIERHIDLKRITDRVADAIVAFHNYSEKALNYG